jgi:hypothetical protein
MDNGAVWMKDQPIRSLDFIKFEKEMLESVLEDLGEEYRPIYGHGELVDEVLDQEMDLRF